jgi:hypothetical protein
MTDVLPAWITVAEAAVKQASDVAGTRDRIAVLGKLQEVLDRLLGDLPALAEAAALGNGSWWIGVTAPPSLWADLRKLQQTADTPNENTVQRFERELRDLLNQQVRVRLLERWAAHVREVIGEMPEAAKALKELGGAGTRIGNLATDLDREVRRFQSVGKRLPTEADVHALRVATETFDQIERELPAGVRDFVIAATRPEGASLDLFDGARDWLAEQTLLGSVRVRFGTGAERAP